MSRIRANQITNQAADGAPTVQHGLIIAGVSTFTGSVSIGGTLTYEDVTNIDSIGIVTARGGIHIDDSIVHIGDTDTKIRFPAANQISFETGGTNRLKIHNYDSNNNVEVDASAHFSLANNGSNGRFIYIGDANASSTGYMHLQPGGGSQGFGGGIRLYSHANSTNAGGVYIGKSLNSSGAIIFGNGGMTPSTEYLRITSAGNVTVGGHTAALSTYNSSQPRLSIYKSSGSGGYLELGGNISNHGHSSGTILFINNDNSDATNNNANGKILAMQRVENVTSDTNAGDDMGGDLAFHIKPEAGSLTERLRIHSTGLVTAPFQYHLHVQRSNNQTGYNASGAFGTPMIFNQIVSENKDSSLSSCYNTSNGLFTAPVTGLYLFNASVYGGSGNIFSQSWFTLNGSRAAGTDWVINSGYAFVQNTQVIRLAAGNTVGFKPYAGGQSNVTLNANTNHTYFKVTLIG